MLHFSEHLPQRADQMLDSYPALLELAGGVCAGLLQADRGELEKLAARALQRPCGQGLERLGQALLALLDEAQTFDSGSPFVVQGRTHARDISLGQCRPLPGGLF